MAMDTSAFRGTASAPKTNRKFFQKNKQGQLEEVFLPDDAFRTPPFGRYNLRLKALGEPYERTGGQFGPERKIRFVFKVMSEGPAKGFMFGVPMTCWRKNADGDWYLNVGPGSQVGKLITAARGKPVAIGEGFDFLSILNLDVNAAVDPSEQYNDQGEVTAVYGNIVKDSYKPVSGAGQAALPAAEPEADPEPEPVAVTAGANPFVGDDD